MGQRHQAFMIARCTRGGRTRYRSVGVLHHQGCYGSLPLKAAHRFMILIKQPDNAEVIREELRVVGYNNIPCPFTQFLFLSAWSVDLNSEDSLYGSGARNLEADMGPSEGDNNDGITIIDVTDPEDAAYCFVYDPHLLAPITAEEYIRHYYSEEDEEGDEDIRNLVQSALPLFVDVPLISLDILLETWPYYSYRTDESDGESENEDEVEEAPANDGVKSTVLNRNEVPFLVSITLMPAVERAMSEGNIEVLDALILDRYKAHIIENHIRSKPRIPEAAFNLILKLLHAHEKPKSRTIDLSKVTFSGEQIIRFVREYADVQKLDVDVLKLSNNDLMDVNALRRILAAFPLLRRLVLFNTAITDTELIPLVRDEPGLFLHTETLIHPAFINVSAETTQFTPSFTYLGFTEHDEATEVSIPFFTHNSLIHALTALMRLFNNHDRWARPFTNEQVAMAAFATETGQPGKSWNERTVPFVPSSSGGGQWTFVIVYGSSQFLKEEAHEKSQYHVTMNHYAFIRLHKEAIREEEAIGGADESFVFGLYDIRTFFAELEREGRPAPDPDNFKQLCDTFDKSTPLLSRDSAVKLLKKGR